MSYNRNTYAKLLEYIILTRKDGEESYPSSKKKRNRELEKIRKEGKKLLDIVVRLIRYRNKLDYRKIGIISVIKVICEHYILSEDNEFILDDRTEENLLGNKELLTYRYIIENDELDIRFAKFEEWLEEIESITIKNKRCDTMRHFKEILHLEENIVEENRKKVKEFQKKNGYEIDIEEIRRIINFGVEYEIMKTKDFMENYIIIKELDDEEIIKELRRWYSTNITECSLCNKMILTKEAVEYNNKEFIKRICKRCYEKELENSENENELNNETEIEKRLEQLKNLIKVLEIEVSDGKLLRLISMEYKDVDILNADFIKKFINKWIKKEYDKILKNIEKEEKYVQENGILYKIKDENKFRVIRRFKLEGIMYMMHDHELSAHFGIQATYEKVKEKYWWKNMKQDVEKYPEAKAIKEANAKEISKFIYEEIICRHRCPKKILTDNESEFNNQLTKNLTEKFNVQHKFSTPYYPKTNGLVERFNKTLIESLAKLVKEKLTIYRNREYEDKNWDQRIAPILFAYRNDEEVKGTTMIKRIEYIIEELPIKRYEAKKNIKKAQEQQKKYHDKIGKQKQNFQIEDKVLYFDTAKYKTYTGKLEEKWKGPYYIHEIIVNRSYKIKELNGRILKRPVNGKLLKEYFDREIFEPYIII
ncbi:unnamed protein product [Rhizophagus irregularis]|nr:unnamed protein product [Rhizophagus irregularis]